MAKEITSEEVDPTDEELDDILNEIEEDDIFWEWQEDDEDEGKQVEDAGERGRDRRLQPLGAPEHLHDSKYSQDGERAQRVH